MQITDKGQRTFASQEEIGLRREFLRRFRECPIPGDETTQNLGLFLDSKLWSRLLFLHHIYLEQLRTHGVIMDFGTRWGQNMAVFSALRGVYEPFNRQRRIIGFDTFDGLRGVTGADGGDEVAVEGGYSVTEGYETYLEAVLEYHENANPMGHVKRFDILKGDAPVMLEKYLRAHPETMVSLAYFDMDLYAPTVMCLQLLKPHMNRGCIVGFDELCDDTFPGETVAFREALGTHLRVRRLPITSRSSYVVIE